MGDHISPERLHHYIASQAQQINPVAKVAEVEIFRAGPADPLPPAKLALREYSQRRIVFEGMFFSSHSKTWSLNIRVFVPEAAVKVHAAQDNGFTRHYASRCGSTEKPANHKEVRHVRRSAS
jgi:hypothetical protein